MKIEQTAGNFSFRTYTDGYPLRIEMRSEVDSFFSTLSVADLHDLRYCADRMLAQLPPENEGRR